MTAEIFSIDPRATTSKERQEERMDESKERGVTSNSFGLASSVEGTRPPSRVKEVKGHGSIKPVTKPFPVATRRLTEAQESMLTPRSKKRRKKSS